MKGRAFGPVRSLLMRSGAFEHDLIKPALDESQGSVTYAARSLGIFYQSLGYMLETRHMYLVRERTPIRRRARKG
jgi:transcriptional regulator with PAS, ATPase and Fis domain